MKIAYQAILDPQPEGGFTVIFPDLPDAITEGETEAEALFNAAEVLTLTLDARVDEGDEIPEPSDHGGIWVSPAPSCQAALLVRHARNGKLRQRGGGPMRRSRIHLISYF